MEWRFSIVPLGGASDVSWRPELRAGAGGDSGLIAMLEKVTMASVYPGLGSLEVPGTVGCGTKRVGIWEKEMVSGEDISRSKGVARALEDALNISILTRAELKL